ncbi:hypothetical protein SRHO_G00303330 [Serrasalmus rhombeus]
MIFAVIEPPIPRGGSPSRPAGGAGGGVGVRVGGSRALRRASLRLFRRSCEALRAWQRQCAAGGSEVRTGRPFEPQRVRDVIPAVRHLDAAVSGFVTGCQLSVEPVHRSGLRQLPGHSPLSAGRRTRCAAAVLRDF